MWYYCLKIVHILCAALLITSIGHSYRLWRMMHSSPNPSLLAERIQTQTSLCIIPLAVLQLASGFMIMSLQHYHYSELWVMGSVIGFIVVIGTWFSFIYFLVLSQQLIANTAQDASHPKYKLFRRIQFMMLSLCACALVSMIFLMANRTAALP